MHTNHNTRNRKILMRLLSGGIILILLSLGLGSPTAYAQTAEGVQPVTHYAVSSLTLSDGMVLERHKINGPLSPPPGFEEERQPVALPKSNGTTKNAISLPGSKWVLGCSAGAAAHIAGNHYDQLPVHPTAPNAVVNVGNSTYGYTNLYAGPTNGGVMPPDNSLWPTWADITGQTYSNNPLIASKQGVDGRTTRGTIDDYWVSYGSTAPDPYITNGWQQHAWGDAIGDYMYTSQSAYGNEDGATSFWVYQNSAQPLTCDTMASQSLPDGTLGRKRFYEARGYTVTDCYNQPTNNVIPGGFSLAQFKTEIDAGRPVMLGLDGHNVVGIGYDTSSNLIYINDGWDYDTHTMPWGGSYSGMALQDVSIVNLAPISSGPSDAVTTGVFRPSNGLLYLKNNHSTGFADVAINYGIPGDYPVVGDWDGDGDATIGVYRNGSFYLRNENTIGFANIVFPFGQAGDQPVAGDWNGDGIDTIGVYRPSNGQFMLRNSNSAGAADISFFLGNVGDVGIAGDWNGDGKDTTGVFRPINGIIFLKNTNDTGFADVALNYGIPGDKPVIGDWDNDGIDTIGVYRNGTFYLRNSNTIGFADIVYGLGNPGDMPIAGDWDALP